MVTVPTRRLHDGTTLPAIGLGTYPLDNDEAEREVAGALEAGYRLIDTAMIYGNEAGVGRAIARSGISREEIIVTTKLPGRDHGYEQALASFEGSRRRLGLDYVDLYLIHWPLPRLDQYVECWQALIRLREESVARSIGVSNFTAEHIQRLERSTGVLPSVNQIEMHPALPQHELRGFHEAKGVRTQGWRPLGEGRALLEDPEVLAIAERHNVTPGQAVLRWQTQLGSVPIPKSADRGRQRENLDIFGFELTADELIRISARSPHRIGPHPEDYEEF
ncbi:aldo/keto reductase [Streptomyces sp. NPDC127084]|uniref:aldo/keto reductase n=1 Tax=Streptomyces sp. NPDC127084 TaxID=3347133 RepID=UPI003656AD38